MMMQNKLLSLSLAISLCLPSLLTHADTAPTTLNKRMQEVVDNYYEKYSQLEQFTAISASVLVPTKDQPISSKDITTIVKGTMGKPPFNQPISTNDLFDIGSITKSFTALILLQLQTEGKLSLDDSLGKWLPQYPQWKSVTLRQLLNMTSSIPNYSNDPKFNQQLENNMSRVWTNEELLTYAHPEKPLKINKENLYEYCNSNYILAALVIEKATKDSYENQLEKRILNQKNGLNNSYYPAGPQGIEVEKAISKRKIHGYYYNESTKKLVDTISNNLSWGGAAGAIVANTENVAVWVQLLYHGQLISPPHREAMLAEMESLVSTKTGKHIAQVTEKDRMGFALGIASIFDAKAKQRFWFYEGSTLGFRVMYLWSPCNNVTTVVALNSKGGEGDAKSTIGDHIHEANINLYQAIMQQYPLLNCNN